MSASSKVSSDLILYDYPRSTASYRVRIALALKNVPYQKQEIHLLNHGGEQFSSEYHQKNPQHLVPSLKVGGVTLTQSMAIIEFLEAHYPEPALLPADPILKAKVRAAAQLIACDIHPLNNLRVLKFLTSDLGVEESLVKGKWYHHWITEGFTALETLVAPYGDKGPYCFGDTLTLADVCLIPQMFNAKRFECPLTGFPRLQAINDHCLKIKAFTFSFPRS